MRSSAAFKKGNNYTQPAENVIKERIDWLISCGMRKATIIRNGLDREMDDDAFKVLAVKALKSNREEKHGR